jgi:hypothetical protein
MRTRAPLILVSLTIALAAAPAAAQQVLGTVTDEISGEPIAGADLLVRDSSGAILDRGITDEDGRFLLAPPRSGTVTLEISRIGYQDFASGPFEVGAGERVVVELRLGIEAVPVEPLVVRDRSRQYPPDIEAFYARADRGRRSGDGRFITRADVERAYPSRTTDLLRVVGGIQVVRVRGAHGYQVRMRGGCVPALYIDGAFINRFDTRASLDDYVDPGSIEGIEVYRGTGRAVGHLHDPRGCGLILIWTQRGERGLAAPIRWRTVGIVVGTLVGLLLVFR